ncbi:RidA family protein [Microlunatus flavus]|uniref:2-iminobutanoate/2-iminopropanoate deaminase n=1 Tax=Microlunatus flavus TaxID=1036181 RepID=A0A1H9L050_9ACTN|nr:RidA family protein [Microlunatus flavus]SER04871.1 2-iminobutanoate/2-iminopropanoate deaminase [Microlunatus flavus]
MRETFVVPGAPPPAGHYSHAVRVGDVVYVSGQVPRDSTGAYTPADVATETRLTLGNLATVAAAAGASLADAVKVTVYLADLAYTPEFNRAYAEFFPTAPPVRTLVAAGLRDVKVEVDAILHLDRG